MSLYTINLNSIVDLSDEKFSQICQSNPEIKFERNIKGELIIMSPTGGETGRKNVELAADIVIWNRQKKLGVVFDSSTCFKLSSGALRSPDVAWIVLSRWNTLTPTEKAKFPPITPDFVMELLSNSDNLSDTQDKMMDYIEAGVRLGWLIDPKAKTVYIYRHSKAFETVKNATQLLGEDVLPELEIDLSLIWK